MNPKHLTPNVRKTVSEAILKLKEIKNAENSNFKKTGKAFETDEELINFFKQYYEKIKNEIDDNFTAFSELCFLEDKYEFCSNYIGSEKLNSNENTIIKINSTKPVLSEVLSFHECKYCGAMTDKPDETCYKAPKKKKQNLR